MEEDYYDEDAVRSAKPLLLSITTDLFSFSMTAELILMIWIPFTGPLTQPNVLKSESMTPATITSTQIKPKKSRMDREVLLVNF